MNLLHHPDASGEQPGAPLTAGQMLRSAREAQGMHLAVLSVNLKVSVRQLEALEADRHEVFKGATFVRALAQSVCRQLRIDPAPVLAALPQNVGPSALEPVSLASRQAVNRPAAAVRAGHSGKPLSRQVLVLALLMVLGAAALIWWPLPVKDKVAEEVQDPAQAAVPMGQASDPVQEPFAPASAEAVTPAPAAMASEAQPARLPASNTAAALPVTPPVAAAPAPAAVRQASAPAVSAPASAPAGDAPLTLRLTADAWVEVRDGRGQMLIKRVVKAGETLQQQVEAPVFVYVGRADSAELRWHGKLQDLQPYTRNNEARLQLKP